MTALNKLKADGKIRYIGVSNFNQEQILECEKYTQIDVIQPPYSMVSRRDEDLMKWCVARGIDTFTYGSLGAGILTGTFRTPPEFHPGDPRNGFYPFFKEPNFSKVMKVLEVMDGISAEIGKRCLRSRSTGRPRRSLSPPHCAASATRQKQQKTAIPLPGS